MNSNSIIIARAGLLSALTIVFCVIAQFAFFALPLAFLIPVPMILLGSEYGVKWQALGILTVFLVLSMLMGPVASLFYSLFALTSFAVAAGYRWFKSTFRVLFLGSLFIGGAFYLEINYLEVFLTGKNQMHEAIEMFQKDVIGKIRTEGLEPLRKQKETLQIEYEKELKNLTASVEETDKIKTQIEDITLQERNLETMITEFKRMADFPLPFFLFSQFIFLILVIRLSGYFSRRFQMGHIPSLDFLNWNCPGSVSWGFLGLMFLAAIWPELKNLGGGNLFLTIGYLMQMIYFVFGLSFISFFLTKWKVSKPLQIVFWFFSVLFMHVLVFIGIFDSLFNLRKAYAESGKGA